MNISNQLANHHSLTDLTPEELFLVGETKSVEIPYIVYPAGKEVHNDIVIINTNQLINNHKAINSLLVRFSLLKSQTPIDEINKCLNELSELLGYDFNIISKTKPRFCYDIHLLFNRIEKGRYTLIYNDELFVDSNTVVEAKTISILLSVIEVITKFSSKPKTQFTFDFIVEDEDGEFAIPQEFLNYLNTVTPDFDYIEL